ncbi:bifunctional adenosylcobinamide kinase/adenosylcobinamide-phosphate guanylyltransferase [Micropruina sonneratiae]|uniref:bifunctional adenosylcobinamide kinase/adenosylcobinamide-phosphate guanylyltransferase n=1 Tax=Micropruina sonneratiae TaxID=2986940 RepID=UPI002227027A|nr:bifunctional adenosylcobinamide kinase/adenosylcobinamide-phosphate guanylyltransferase [Micropruina sp. KQZ13P-5]MCW3158728.1 bifunctional adenosylcobinamide kinase/adenosylcobinamide-phosphate guanylyltransferase [Micropruina sp. KQZ13P-5]
MSAVSKVLVTGGVRSGKSRYAESLLASADAVTYLTPGYPADPVADPEWAARVGAHQARRPATWTTVETVGLAAGISAANTPVLIDCLGTWLTRSIDGWGWEAPFATWQPRFERALDDLVDAWRAHPHTVVAVTNEVGWGLISEHASGRLFADLLGRTNQRVGAVADEVVLLVAGRPLHLG